MLVNLTVPTVMTRVFKDDLVKSQGCIVNLSAVEARRPDPACLAWSMSKAGLEMLTKTAAVELAPKKVRVNAVAPTE